jgi:hypothetical protein
MTPNSNHNFLAFDRQIESCGGWLEPRIRDAFGYDAGVLLDRLLQRLAEIGLQPYTRAASVLSGRESYRAPAPGTPIECKGARMEAGSGGVSVTVKQWLASHAEFLAHWGFCLAAITSGRGAGAPPPPAVLVSDVGDENVFGGGSDEQFIEYCREGAVEPLRRAKRLVVQSASGRASSRPAEFSYARQPLVALLRETRLGVPRRAGLVARHLWLLLAYLAASLRLPALTLLARDLPYTTLARALDRGGAIDAVVTTCSSYTSQALWMRALERAKVHMVWYSQNWKPIVYAADAVSSDLPNLRWIRVDVHWVWTRAFANYLSKLQPHARVETVGPIVWYLPPKNVEAAAQTADGRALEIAIFDVPAIDDEVLLDLCGELTNYYHPAKLRAFIADTLSIKPALEHLFGRPVRFSLKVKREAHSHYNQDYYRFLADLETAGALELESHAENLYALVARSDLVIAYPYTSAAYLAGHLHVPAIFYDPTGAIVQDDFADDRARVLFASSAPDLLNAATSALARRHGGPKIAGLPIAEAR